MPATGVERRRVLRRMALATGAIEKCGTATYERLIRPAAYRWPEWIKRCRVQAAAAIEALGREEWPDARLDQARITTACMIRYVRMVDAELLPLGRYSGLDALAERCEAREEFAATCPVEYVVPRPSPGSLREPTSPV